MSLQTIIIRCDEPGCTRTMDSTISEQTIGWIAVSIGYPPVDSLIVIRYDYCPAHADDHN